MGLEESYGKVFSYDLSLTNLYKEKGQGMTVAILRVPACLQVNFDHLESLKRNREIAQYEVRSDTSEIIFYQRALGPAETKTFSVDLIQRYQGTCLQKPHTAYFYYNNDEPAWVLPIEATE